MSPVARLALPRLFRCILLNPHATQIQSHDVACRPACRPRSEGEPFCRSMLVREHSPWTRKRARRAAGTRVSRAEELADVTFVLPDDLLLLLVRWHHHAHPPTSSTTLPITSPRRDPHKPHRNRPRHETLPRRRRRRLQPPPTSPTLPNAPTVASSPGGARRRPHYPWRRCANPNPHPHPHPRPNSHPSPNLA